MAHSGILQACYRIFKVCFCFLSYCKLQVGAAEANTNQSLLTRRQPPHRQPAHPNRSDQDSRSRGTQRVPPVNQPAVAGGWGVWTARTRRPSRP